VETRHVFPAEVPAEVAAEIERTVRAALAVVGFRHGASHTEVRLAGGEVMVIEINGRLAGGMIPELVRLATGVDLVDQQIRAACGLATEPARQPTESAGIQFVIASDTGTLDRFEGAEEAGRLAGVETVALTAGAGTLIRPAQDAYDRLGYVIARGARPADVAETLNKARELIQAVVTRKPVGADPTEEGDRACEI
jgi:cysteine synthase A